MEGKKRKGKVSFRFLRDYDFIGSNRIGFPLRKIVNG